MTVFSHNECVWNLRQPLFAEIVISEMRIEVSDGKDYPIRIILFVGEVVADQLGNNLFRNAGGICCFNLFIYCFGKQILFRSECAASKALAMMSSKRSVHAPFVLSAKIGTCS